MIVFNDYIIYDYANGAFYGVVRAVNELLMNEDWQVCGFALAPICTVTCAPANPVDLLADCRYKYYDDNPFGGSGMLE